MLPTLPRQAARPSAYLLAALVVGLTLASMSRAYAVVSALNGAALRYNLAPGAEFLIGVPVVSQPVHIMATCENKPQEGIAFAEVVRLPAPNPTLMWTGKNTVSIFAASSGTNTAGVSAVDETLIAKMNFDETVELEVQSATTLAVSNEGGGTRAGYVTMIW